MTWGFFNKLKNGIVKVAKGIGKVLKPVVQAILPVAKEVLPMIMETSGNAFKPGLGTVAKKGVSGLMNGLDNLVNDSEHKKQGMPSVMYEDTKQYTQVVQGFIPKTPQVIDKGLPNSFVMKNIGEDFVPHEKGFTGKRC